jgi:hypothetical protein
VRRREGTLLSQALGLLALVGLVAAAGGWVLNLWKAASLVAAGGEPTTLYIGRLLGIALLPLGMILGWF